MTNCEFPPAYMKWHRDVFGVTPHGDMLGICEIYVIWQLLGDINKDRICHCNPSYRSVMYFDTELEDRVARVLDGDKEALAAS